MDGMSIYRGVITNAVHVSQSLLEFDRALMTSHNKICLWNLSTLVGCFTKHYRKVSRQEGQMRAD